jgi:ribose-phosphate pyrophosphokinase
MIRLRCTDSEEWQTITPTIFPDGTSQVWKIKMPPEKAWIKIKWNFESEAELLHLIQLNQLLKQNSNRAHLYIPYLPYARQDKEISNSTTFALNPMMDLLLSNFYAIHTYDMHNPTEYVDEWGLVNYTPKHIIETLEKEEYDVIMFPDEGALKRYSKMFESSLTFLQYPKIYGKKIRDQSTGKITSYEIEDPKLVLRCANVLIVDDICDGGATFIEATSKMKELGAKDIDLCVSHGIFSRGKQILHDAGIRNIFTTNSLIKNVEGYEV